MQFLLRDVVAGDGRFTQLGIWNSEFGIRFRHSKFQIPNS
jgi:hypothetical protein